MRQLQYTRSGKGPSLVVCDTYRWRGHSKSDRNRYRTQEEIDEWKSKDPIERFIKYTMDKKILTEDEVENVKAQAMDDIENARLVCRIESGPGRSNIGRGSIRAMVREITYLEAVREAMTQEMERDERVFLIGEDVGKYGGAFQVSYGMLEKFGPERILDTPITELGIAGAATGAALIGMRPIAEIMFMDFTTLASEQLVNQAAKLRFMFGGKATVPMVLRTPAGSGTGAAEHHSQSFENWFVHVPGLKVVMPTTPYDVKGLVDRINSR